MSVKQQTQLDLTGDLIAKSVKSVTFSKRFTNIIVRCSIFNIIYRRLELKESELKTRNYKGVPYKIIKNPNKSKDPAITSFVSWVEGIQDAIEKNYLREIFLFMKDSTGDLLETYQFKLKYNTDPNDEHKRTLVHVQDDTMALLQVICDLGKNKKLENTKLVIEFKYNDITPFEYEPPGFSPATQPECSKLSDSACNKNLGKLNTGFHKITCRAHGLLTLSRASTPASACFANGRISQEDVFGEKMVIEAENEEKWEKAKSKFNNSCITVLSDAFTHDHSLLSSEDIVPPPENVDCICHLSITDVNIIRCSKCDRKYHAPCYGYMNKADFDVNFSCLECGTTDTMLIEFTDTQLFVKVRLILYFLNKKKKLPKEIFNSLGDEQKAVVLEKLKQSDVYDSETKIFNQNKFDECAPMFFNISNSQFLR
ncbi:HORMA domain-containing protein 1 isoform X1 [Leptinotarsa decemlineata]|uniref:HORMA domain-containing protein 1 isoform X1 n=1 Tax=Leptinotarsa decemlineata TaxID=7539 RepID=UPI003D30CF10